MTASDPAEPPAATPRAAGIVDVHVHAAPQRLAVAVRDAISRQHGWRLRWDVSPEAVLAAVRSSGATLLVHHPYAHRPGIARSLNEWSWRLAAAHADVVGFATVHPDDERPVDVLEEAVGSGCAGLKVHCVVQQVAPDDQRLDDVMAYCEREAIPVLMHATSAPERSSAVAGAAALARLLRSHPRLRLCVAHLGAPETAAVLALCDRYEKVVLDTAAVLDLGRLGVPLDDVLARHDRILYGSDHPNSPVDAGVVLAHVRSAGFDEAALAGVLGGNALRFLGLPARGAG